MVYTLLEDAIVEALMELFQEKHEIDLRTNMIVVIRLRQAAVNARIKLVSPVLRNDGTTACILIAKQVTVTLAFLWQEKGLEATISYDGRYVMVE